MSTSSHPLQLISDLMAYRRFPEAAGVCLAPLGDDAAARQRAQLLQALALAETANWSGVLRRLGRAPAPFAHAVMRVIAQIRVGHHGAALHELARLAGLVGEEDAVLEALLYLLRGVASGLSGFHEEATAATRSCAFICPDLVVAMVRAAPPAASLLAWRWVLPLVAALPNLHRLVRLPDAVAAREFSVARGGISAAMRREIRCSLGVACGVAA